MAEHITSWEGIIAADEQHRTRMKEASEMLLRAMIRELESMGVLA